MRYRIRWSLALLAFMLLMGGQARAQRTVTLKLNTATLPDTLRPTDEVQVRGAVERVAPYTLPDGNIIDWSNNTTLRVNNIGGDYWELTFQIPEDSTLYWKFYSQLAEDDGIGGWEDGADHELAGGKGDTTLPLHYFEKGADKPYDWRPWEEKQDSVAVYFRVYMNTEDAIVKGYDREDPNLVVGVRGDPGVGGVLDWGTTKLVLSPESDNQAAPGYHIFSGYAYWPTSVAGQLQTFKFFIEPGGWEENHPEGQDPWNREFVVPSQDTTLHWVYFSSSKPLKATPVEAEVLFQVDMSTSEETGIYSRARGDSLQVRGSFNGWDCDNPDDCLLFREPGGDVYANVILIKALPQTVMYYKYYLDLNMQDAPNGWEEPMDWGGGNRQFVFEGNTAQAQELDMAFFDDIRQGNVIPATVDSIQVTFRVNMQPATTFQNKKPFNPATDKVSVAFEDELWRLTQNMAVDANNMPAEGFFLEDPDGDMIYEGTFTLKAPTYNGIGFRYTWGNDTDGWQVEGSGGFDPGRRRYQYVHPNSDGTWPTAYVLPLVDIQEEGALPFECNPTQPNPPVACVTYTGVEQEDSTLPEALTLGENYPNPFRDRTTFTYTLDRPQYVSLRVYDLMGRIVATLYEGSQQPATYRVTFDGSHLASGVYIYELRTEDRVLTRKMLLMK